jgi:mycofactocin system glycosyltransferase
VPVNEWLEVLLPHFADPAVGLTAPRIVALGEPSEAVEASEAVEPSEAVRITGWLAAYEQARSSLDLGAEEALVVPHGRVSYVPSAALVARVAALRVDPEATSVGFDEAMRVAEDVDLVWRLAAAGWRCRYVPEAQVAHEHRTALLPWLGRKAYYGTGAAPLARRHPGNVAPVVLPGWAVLVAGSVLLQRRWSLAVAAGVAGAAAVGLARDLPSDRPRLLAAELVGRSLGSTAEQTAGALNRHWWPAAALVALHSRRMRRAMVVAGLGEALLDRQRHGLGHPAELGPLGYLAAHRLDDWAYGAGLWWGAVRHRTLRPLLPAVSTRRGRSRSAPGRDASTAAGRAATTKPVPRPPWNTGARPAPTSGAVAS